MCTFGVLAPFQLKINFSFIFHQRTYFHAVYPTSPCVEVDEQAFRPLLTQSRIENDVMSYSIVGKSVQLVNLTQLSAPNQKKKYLNT